MKVARRVSCMRLLSAWVLIGGAAGGTAAAQSPPEGFSALFNGQDLAGWKGLVADPPRRAKMPPEELAREQEKADEKMRAHWKVVDGVLVFDGKGDNLCSARDYEDFELLVDWKIEKGGDSGVYLRGSPQVQIWDNPEGSGALWNNQKHAKKPLILADRPVGEWNTFRIIMAGERVTVYLNGLLVVDDTVLENYWEADKPIYAAGAIELQNHGNPLYFRNIYIRELPRRSPTPGAQPSSEARSPAAGSGTPPPSAVPAAAQPSSVLRPGGVVAIVGDSITEQKLYSRFIEDYLTACVPELAACCIQLGWGGERADGFAARMENDLLPFEPSVVTTCYGMNDGRYRRYEPAIGQAYESSMRKIVERLRQAGAAVVVGSPGAVDTHTFRANDLPPPAYNDNLAHLRDIARELAREQGFPFANVHDHMILAMARAKAALGPEYHVCGADGFHPAANGHLVMAYAFLKSMGLDGQIATITLDYGPDARGAAPADAPGSSRQFRSASGAKLTAALSPGHKLLGVSEQTVRIESERYPFCFWGDDKSPDGTRSIIPHLPFNDHLNRFTLVVHALPAAYATVVWTDGDSDRGIGKRFSREQLEAGINLAAEFLDNPFCEAFRRVDEAVARKQAFETTMIKECITRFRSFSALLPGDPEAEAAMKTLREELLSRHEELTHAVRAAVTPVGHRITVRPE